MISFNPLKWFRTRTQANEYQAPAIDCQAIAERVTKIVENQYGQGNAKVLWAKSQPDNTGIAKLEIEVLGFRTEQYIRLSKLDTDRAHHHIVRHIEEDLIWQFRHNCIEMRMKEGVTSVSYAIIESMLK